MSEATVWGRVRELDRLFAVRRSGLLDTDPEEAFDRLTRRARAQLHAPVALLSIVDGERQFFKSAQGLQEPVATARETPLSHSFCQYVVARDLPLVVADARLVPVLADSPAIPDLAVIAYAGVPLAAHGHVLGAFCAIDAVPHEWSDEDVAVLGELAAACSQELELRAALREARRAEGERRFRGLSAAHAGGHGHLTGQAVASPTARREHGRRWLHRGPAIPGAADL